MEKKPETIEELKEWYAERGLPPAEVTRFFIGEDISEPKAFGIYRDEATSEYVVYKNKASGERAVRYRGTDEACAVNELYVKLKEEIISRKNSSKNASGSTDIQKNDYGLSSEHSGNKRKGKPDRKKTVFTAGFIGIFAAAAGIICLAFGSDSDDIKAGYYDYNGLVYYCSDDDYYRENGLRWFAYDREAGEWQYPYYVKDMPDELKNGDTAAQFYLGEDYQDKYAAASFSDSAYKADMKISGVTDEGYYRYENDFYYHYKGKYSENWFIFCKAWQPIEFNYLPDGLVHISLSDEYAVGEEKVISDGAGSFRETLYYQDFVTDAKKNRGYYKYNDRLYYYFESDNNDNDDDDCWYYFDDDTWYRAGEFDVPDEFRHNSLIDSYYYSQNLDESEGSGFEDTEEYRKYFAEEEPENDNDDDSSFWDYAADWILDWDSDDSWDAGDSDWDSDW